MEKKIMETKTKKSVKKATTKTAPNLGLMYETISNLTSVVSQLEHDVRKIKTRLGI